MPADRNVRQTHGAEPQFGNSLVGNIRTASRNRMTLLSHLLHRYRLLNVQTNDHNHGTNFTRSTKFNIPSDQRWTLLICSLHVSRYCLNLMA